MKMNSKKGFTLIELLVVVAIIGILASVVLASLTSARAKGRDAAIFAQLSNMRAQAELFYTVNGNYGGSTTAYTALTSATTPAGVDITPSASCATSAAPVGAPNLFTLAAGSSGLDGLIKGACSSGATAITASVLGGVATAWALKATAVSASTAYCVDSTGAAKTAASFTLASAACP